MGGRWQTSFVGRSLPAEIQGRSRAHLAARAGGKRLDPELLRDGINNWADDYDIVVIEGAGGLMTPISDEEFVADVALDFGYPVVIVAPNVLGVINQTLQTMITASCFRDGIEVAGIVLNDSQVFEGDQSTESNEEEIARRSLAPVLARVRYKAEEFDRETDWWESSKPSKSTVS